MMQEGDPRVQELQSTAWGLQSLSTKPGNKLPEKSKRKSYALTSKALALCADAEYTEESDFVERAAVFRKQIEAKKVELQEEDAAIIKDLQGKCYVASGGGGSTYTVGFRTDAGYAAAEPLISEAQPAAPKLLTSADAAPGAGAGGIAAGDGSRSYAPAAPALTAEEVARCCSTEPTALRLSGRGLRDSDMEALCQGLQGACGAELLSLDLSDNVIADTGIQRLVTALASKACPRLTDLWLGGNCFGPLGTQMLQGGLGALRKGLAVHLEAPPLQSFALPAAGPPPPRHQLQQAVGEAEGATDGGAPAAAAPATAPVAASSIGAHAAQVATEDSGARSGATSVGSAAPADAREAVGGAAVTSSAATAAGRVEVLEGGAEIRATIPLPDHVASVRDLDLNISEDRLMVRATSGECLLDEELPHLIDPDSAQASFSKKRRSLTVVMRPAAGPAG